MLEIQAWKFDTEGLYLQMDLGEKKDYSIDWTDFLEGAALNLAEVVIGAGLTQVGPVVVNGNISKVVLSAAGAAGTYACNWKLTFGAGNLIEILKFRVLVT